MKKNYKAIASAVVTFSLVLTAFVTPVTSVVATGGHTSDPVCDLKVTKTVDKTKAVPGDTLTYEITVKNVGDANCTGGGVRIVDVVDNKLTFQSQSVTSNLSAGYGSKSVYTAGDRTLRFNGHVLEPGESGKITWTGKVDTPDQCGDFVIKNQAKATAKELNNFKQWSYSQTVKTNIDHKCEQPPERPSCPYTEADGELVIFDKARLVSNQTAAKARTAAEAVSLPAGEYAVKLVAWDGYLNRVNATQPNEQYKVVITNPTGVVAESNDTDDLADMVKSAIFDGEVNSGLVLSEAATEVYALHSVYKDDSSPNSLEPICAVFVPADEPAPSCDSFTAVPGDIMVGESAVLFWETSNATDVSINNGVGAVDPDGSISVSPLVDTVYELTVVGADQQVVTCEVPVNVTDTPAPSCDSFTANPSTIMVGDSTTLTWETTNATDVFINNGVGAVDADGSVSVSPLADIVYELTVMGVNDQEVKCEVPVTVSEDSVPVCESFTVTPNSLPELGGEVTLDWTVLGATEVSIAPTVGAVGLSGTRSLNVTEDTTFVLTAVDADQDTVSCEAPVVLDDPQPDPFSCEENVTFTASDTSIRRGQEVTLTWSTVDVDTVDISVINSTALSGSQKVSPSDDVTYVLTATKGEETVTCPLSVDVSSGGGGGGSSVRCDLDISDTKIKLGEEITLTWDTTRATEVTITDDTGKVIVSTDDFLADEKDDYLDGSITLKPTRDTEYLLLAERGSRDAECEVEVEIEDTVVVLETRDQQPLVAGISLSSTPYTGFEAGPFMTFMFYILLVVWALYITYLIVIRNRVVAARAQVTDLDYAPVITEKESFKLEKEEKKEAVVESVAAPAAPSYTAPVNLPIGEPVVGYDNVADPKAAVAHKATDEVVTALENQAHEKMALLSSDAMRYFISVTSTEEERVKNLDEVIAEAKKVYPLEDGWIVINESRMKNLCEACKEKRAASEKAPFIPATVPEGTGSLAEAIVTGNVVAAYDLIGKRPMFSLADAATDLDTLYRSRKGAKVQVSELLKKESVKLSDDQIKEMIVALTSALDGTYTDEASAVKMAIMKAVKAAS